MSAASNYLENALLDNYFGTGCYVALFSDTATDAGGTELASSNGYARQALTVASAASGAIANTVAITFTASGGAWSAALSFGIYDAITGGNLLAHGALSASRTAGDGDSISFAIGDLDISAA